MEEKHLLESALNEINSLRRSNELMRARLNMFDMVMSALHGEPAKERSGLVSIDVAYSIQKRIAAIETEIKPQ